MLKETLHRISGLVNRENIYIAANKIHSHKIKQCIKDLSIPEDNFLFEPESKNNLAPVALLASRIYGLDKDAVIMLLPSDHFIKPKKRFLKLLSRAIGIAKSGFIVTFGIKPRRPETGFGYIKVNSKLGRHIANAYKVDKFIEKPGLSRARKFIKDKRFYWNSGIFVFKAKAMLEEIKNLLPAVYKTVKGSNKKNDLSKLWPKFPALSIDYAVMERTKKLVLLPADYEWSDLGSWLAIEDVRKKDKHGNIFKCRYNYINLGSKNTTVWSGCRFVATLGLRNVVVVDTKDALLVCSKDRAQDIKKVVQVLKQKKLTRYI